MHVTTPVAIDNTTRFWRSLRPLIGGTRSAAETVGWIVDVQGGGSGLVIEIPLEGDDEPFDTIYVEAAQVEQADA